MNINNQNLILGIETSCDDTSMALIDASNGKIIKIITINQNNIHEKYQGIVPALAVMGHLFQLKEVFSQLKASVPNLEDYIKYIAVTNGPGLSGSLLMGVNFAYGLKKYFKDIFNNTVEVYLTDHIEGHLLINLCHQWIDFPFLGVIMSGGHTLVIHCKSLGCYEIFSSTLDDAIGECLDKCGRFLNLPYPGGISIEQLALQGKNIVPLPIPMAKNISHQMSFSGLKTAVFYNHEKYLPEDMACSIQYAAIISITKVIQKAAKLFNINGIIFGGGVISNKFFREYLTNNLENDLYFPGPGLSTDSGAMAASVMWTYLKLNQLANLKNDEIFIYNNLLKNKNFYQKEL